MDLSQQISAPRHIDGNRTEAPVGHAAYLSRIIEAEIIPRLMLAHRAEQGCMPLVPVDVPAPSADDIAEFARTVLSSPVGVASSYVDKRRQEGASLESVYLDLLSPTARHLGCLWEQDLCDFTDVTLGLWRLQQLLHELSPAFRTESPQLCLHRKTLLVPAPGEQHTFGLFMVSEFFRRAGWHVCGELPTTLEQLITMVRNEAFHMIGFTAGCELRLEPLRNAITAVRQASRNRELVVMVGGPIFQTRPDYVDAVGADATAADGRDAVARADALAARQSAKN